MLAEAFDWRPGSPRADLDNLLLDPHIGHYINGWKRPDDLGVVAIDNATRVPIAATWCRQLRADDPGYGYIADDIPELTIGVEPDRRGLGIGTALLSALIDEATQSHIPALSLSVEHDNPAVRLYTRLGFTITDDATGAWTMIRHLQEPTWQEHGNSPRIGGNGRKCSRLSLLCEEFEPSQTGTRCAPTDRWVGQIENFQ